MEVCWTALRLRHFRENPKEIARVANPAWAEEIRSSGMKSEVLFFLKSFFMNRANPSAAMDLNLKILAEQKTSYNCVFYNYRKYFA